MPKASINYALAATLITGGQTYDQAARECGALNGESLRRGLNRKGVTVRHCRTLPLPEERVMSGAKRVALQANEILSRQTREGLAQTVADGLKRVKAVPLRNIGTDKALKHAQTLKSLAETGKIAFPDWNETGTQSLVQVNILNQLNPETVQADNATVIDVTPEPETPK